MTKKSSENEKVYEYDLLPEVVASDYFLDQNKPTIGFYSTKKDCSNCHTTFFVYVKQGNFIYDMSYSNTKRHSFKCRNCGCTTIHFYTQKDTPVEGSK